MKLEERLGANKYYVDETSPHIIVDGAGFSLEEKMKEHLGTKVKITAKNEDKGKVEIEYYSKEDLDRITRILEGRGEE